MDSWRRCSALADPVLSFPIAPYRAIARGPAGNAGLMIHWDPLAASARDEREYGLLRTSYAGRYAGPLVSGPRADSPPLAAVASCTPVHLMHPDAPDAPFSPRQGSGSFGCPRTTWGPAPLEPDARGCSLLTAAETWSLDSGQTAAQGLRLIFTAQRDPTPSNLIGVDDQVAAGRRSSCTGSFGRRRRA
ncbi:hypothetical protein EG329_003449 [Mollisiaceae sp. DMI_Dod_QoI]|nr:hypothetical protein EG329_003449 [Helotiales sp. DMI_Dod_QoI]